ncbi:MAG: helix-hairpin-helix domain-containing protein [Ignavibacteriales bacterium]|nr:helix-hairpin-helix domain-containing protein [Ignavibacteriales bacterium]
MKSLEKFSKKIGFTSTETNVILFILTACLIGVAVNIIKDVKNDKTFLEFDSKQEDSLFNAASGGSGVEDSTILQVEKKIASKPELLDFNKEVKTGSVNKISSLRQKISLNKANISELMKLPGFGQKTAGALLEYRNKHGKIKSLNELLNIKGIGKKKLEKIKNLVIIE